jgi:hypothetical protein
MHRPHFSKGRRARAKIGIRLTPSGLCLEARMTFQKAVGLVSFAALFCGFVACSSSTENNPGNDAGFLNNLDSGSIKLPPKLSEAGVEDGGGTGQSDGGGLGEGDGGVAPDAAAEVADDTVGLACTMLSDCEKAGASDKACSSDAFGTDTVNPSPVCVGTCKFDSADKGLQLCDGERGICDPNNTCFPVCAFDSATLDVPCVGKNACLPWGYGFDDMAKKGIGLGKCYGGCVADADCTGGNKCDPQDGICKATVVAATKPVGSACTGRSDNACTCLAPPTGPGVCSVFCKTGATAQGTCSANSVCSAQMPKTQKNGMPLFTGQPEGMAGFCFKACAVDADCTGGFCSNDDPAGKLCLPGKRPGGGQGDAGAVDSGDAGGKADAGDGG